MTDTQNALLQSALSAGFDHAVHVALDTLTLYPAVREMCEQNRCHQYGASWICPPACGTLDECRARISRYSAGLMVQTVATVPDMLDYPAMLEVELQHKALFMQLYAEMLKDYPNMLALGAGGCKVCQRCTYPDAPCRFPSRAISSMEAYGMLVSEVCQRNGMAYHYDKNSIAFMGLYLY